MHLISPCSGNKAGSLENVDEWTDYTFIPNKSLADPMTSVLVYCQGGCREEEGGHIAYAGGNVNWVEKAEFDETIAGLR